MKRGSDTLVEYWRTLRRRRTVVFLGAVIGVILAFVASFMATPLFRATASIQIERQSPAVLDQQDISRIDYSFLAYGDFYQTQYRIIGSDAVARRAADRLDLVDHPLLNEQRGPGPVARLKRVIGSLIPRRRPAGSSRSGGDAVELTPEDLAAAFVQGGLNVSPVRNSHLVNVSFIGEDPQLTADVANAVSRAYIQYNIESQFNTTEAAGEFLIEQIANLKQEILEAERELQEYGEEKSIFSVAADDNMTLQALRGFSSEVTGARMELARAEARYNAVVDAPAEGLEEVRQSVLIGQLLQEHAALDAEWAAKSRIFKDDWPGMRELRTRLDQAHERLELETARIAGQVRASAQAEYERARKAVDNLDSLLGGQEQAAQQQRRDAVEFINLQTEADKKRETLDALIQRQNEMALSMRLTSLNSASTNVRVVEPARVPLGQFRPRTSVNLAIGLMLGLGFGVGLAFALEYLDNTINTPDEIERLVDLPTLAAIPYTDQTPTVAIAGSGAEVPFGKSGTLDLISFEEPRAPVSEAFRELRTAILLSHAGEPPRQLMITSAEPEEGKSSTAMNLAITLAQLGQRVLLVDTDLRRPRQHKTFGLKNDVGVTTYLSGLEDDVSRLPFRTPVENLDILCSGPVPPNPSELLNSPRFSEMGRELLQAGYEHIIYDSAPLLAVSDPVIIASRVETAIVVVRAGRTSRQAIRVAVEKLRQTPRGAAGVVLNGVDAAALGANRYDYYGEGEPVRPQTRRERRRSRAGGLRA